jgi:hypothetical protein
MRAIVVSAVVVLLSAANPPTVLARASGYVNPHYHWVEPYNRSDGRSVRGHYQTDSNGTKCDNYSTQGNVNPHTGQPGTKPGC